MELKRGNVEQAERYLKRSDVQMGAAQNNQGVYHLLKGEIDQAEACFKKAQELGAEQAKANLTEVQKVREDNRAFGN